MHAGYARYFTPPASELIQQRHRAVRRHHQQPSGGNNTPLAERSDYYDIGISQQLGDHLTLGLDAYDRRVARLQDEGQFGAAYIYSTFNYRRGHIRGLEFSGNGPFSAYFNAAYNKAIGQVITSQYNLDPDALAYVANHWIHLDHDQKLTSSAVSATPLPGTTGSVPTTVRQRPVLGRRRLQRRRTAVLLQVNLSAGHDFNADSGHPRTCNSP